MILKRLEEALASFDKAVAVKTDYTDALYNRGNAFKDLKRAEEALASYDQPLAINPAYAEALNNRGIALGSLKRLEEALASFDKALAVKPDYVEALNNRGIALKDLKRPEEALAIYCHLAGALGRPVWVLLKHVPDWRWMLDRSDSPWYSTMKLYRQTTRDDWDGVFDQVATDVAKFEDRHGIRERDAAANSRIDGRVFRQDHDPRN